jgi:hypothetical protein
MKSGSPRRTDDCNCTDFRQSTPPSRHALVGMKADSATNTNPAKKLPGSVTERPKDIESQIRQFAYELYEARGREGGYEVEDWLRAEEKITLKKVRSIAAITLLFLGGTGLGLILSLQIGRA